MTKSDNEAILLLAGTVNALTERCKILERSMRHLFKENDKLRAQLEKKHGLEGVNV